MGFQNFKNFIILNVVLLLLIQGLIASKSSSKCPPRIKVRKDTIIRTKESINNGARMLYRSEIETSRECYEICCERETCNVGIVHYKKQHDEYGQIVTTKTCFVFACGTPNRCIFMNHTGYAVIEMNREKPKSKAKPVKVVHPIVEEDCPAGAPMAMCAADPCESATCPGHESARCVPNYCGGCNAFFYNNLGKKIQCGKQPEPEAMPTPKPDVDESEHITDKPHETDTTKDEDNVNEEEVEIRPEDTEGKPTEDPNSPDANPDPHRRKQFRTWLDSRDDYVTENPSKAKTGKAPPAENDEQLDKSDQLNIKKSKRPSLRIESKLNGSDTTLSLAIALTVCVVVLVAVIVKLKCRGPKTKKKFAVDDGDYLINGMYL